MAATLENLLVSQFFRAILTDSVSEGDTEVFVDEVSGFPTMLAGQYFYLTLVADDTTAETVRIGAVDVGNKKLTLFGTSTVGGTFPATSRAELWFTAEAFKDIQDWVEGLEFTGGAPSVDNLTLEDTGTVLRVKTASDAGLPAGDLFGVGETHLKNEAVSRRTIVPNAVGTLEIENLKVTNGKILSLDADKLIGTVLMASIPVMDFSKLDYGTHSGA